MDSYLHSEHVLVHRESETVHGAIHAQVSQRTGEQGRQGLVVGRIQQRQVGEADRQPYKKRSEIDSES